MRISKYIRASAILMIALVSLSGSYFFAQKMDKPLIFIPKQHSSFNIENHLLDYLNFGQKRLISSLLWIATILESDHDHYKGKDLNSWMFLRFSTISYLEPKFYETYAFGGPYLSIIKDDILGASIIYEKGLKEYPEDYHILYNAGFHFYFEAHDYEKAYPILKKLMSLPKTTLLMFNSLARLEAKRGNLKDAFLILSQYQNSFPSDSLVWKKIYEFRYSIKAEMDLNCLNKKLANCSVVDLDGIPYIKRNETYRAIREWIPFKVKENKN